MNWSVHFRWTADQKFYPKKILCHNRMRIEISVGVPWNSFENFSVLSPIFKHFKLFGSVLPSGMVTVKCSKTTFCYKRFIFFEFHELNRNIFFEIAFNYYGFEPDFKLKYNLNLKSPMSSCECFLWDSEGFATIFVYWWHD